MTSNYLQIQKGLECLKKLDSTIPEGYREEFREIAPIFVEPYCRFMQQLKGPAYTPPVFDHVHLSAVAKRPTVADVSPHDIIDMTQPSQQTTQVPTHPTVPASQATSSRPEKMDVRRPGEQKWLISKKLSEEKMAAIRRDWGWVRGQPVGLRGGIKHDLMFNLAENSMQSLAPGAWIDDRIIYGYMVLFHLWCRSTFKLCCLYLFCK